MQGRDASTCDGAEAVGNKTICGTTETTEPEEPACSSEGKVQKLDIWMDKGYVNINCVGAGACIHIHKVILAAMSCCFSLLLRLWEAAVAVTPWCQLMLTRSMPCVGASRPAWSDLQQQTGRWV